MIVAEGYKEKIEDVTKIIEGGTGISARVTVLGHIQRGGAPTAMTESLQREWGIGRWNF